jgi:hypothetical protein
VNQKEKGKKEKKTMFSDPVTNIVTPMGSVFNIIEPGEGIMISECGKLKVGGLNSSRKLQG